MEKPWETEPSFRSFDHEGINCVIRRTHTLGFLCGYVRIPKGHPDYGVEYMDWPEEKYSVHGGITFSDSTTFDGRVAKGWFIGFDCAHYTDYVPLMEEFMNGVRDGMKSNTFTESLTTEENYKKFDFVEQEVKALAEQVLKWNVTATATTRNST